ncbi:MAG TPA: Arc family DNA-binding protein [Stellaceae bacterium]|jgi:plasmid stability protein|nr:Arc family DNA-binding protein [Stellaceae bacterium]
MSTLTIRNVEPVLKERLRVRAAQHGRSMEAELRVILKDVLRPERQKDGIGLAEAIHQLFAPLGGADDLVIPPRTEHPGPMKFDE